MRHVDVILVTDIVGITTTGSTTTLSEPPNLIRLTLIISLVPTIVPYENNFFHKSL